MGAAWMEGPDLDLHSCHNACMFDSRDEIDAWEVTGTCTCSYTINKYICPMPPSTYISCMTRSQIQKDRKRPKELMAEQDV